MSERRDDVDEQTEREKDPKEREHRNEEIRGPPVHERRKSPAPRREARKAAALQVAQGVGRGDRIHRTPGRTGRATPQMLAGAGTTPYPFFRQGPLRGCGYAGAGIDTTHEGSGVLLPSS